MKIIVLSLVFSLIAFSIAAQDVVQISDERDVNDKFTNFVDLVVIWDEAIQPTVPDEKVMDNDSLQEWYVKVTGGYKKFTFTRTVLGEYAVKWSQDGAIWSEVGVCVLAPPDAPIHTD